MRVSDLKTGREYFSKRRRRFETENTPRELTFSCFHGYKFLAKQRTRTWFVEALRDAISKSHVDLWAWVLMPEHVHLIVWPQSSGASVSIFLRTVKEKVARQAIKHLVQNAPQWLERITIREGARIRRRFWQPGGGYDRNIDSTNTLWAMIDYLHLNPVRRGLVERATDWEWSSARWYAGIRPVHLEMSCSLASIMNVGGTP
jgi:putative transposase